MNYDQPRQHKDGGWHYTSMNDGQIWAIGYCPDHAPHATEDEARECYTQYLLNERLVLDGQWATEQHHCQVCQAWTDRFAQVNGWTTYDLCDEHRTREHVAELMGTVGDSIHS